jgi:hypothetical protein
MAWKLESGRRRGAGGTRCRAVNEKGSEMLYFFALP